MAQYIQITYHHQEGEQGEDDEILHRRSVSLSVVLILRLAEYKRFVSIAESLGYHCHDHRNLAGCSVDSELRMSIALLIDVREENLVGCLVQNTGNTKHEDRPAVAKHFFDEHLSLSPRGVRTRKTFLQFLIEEDSHGRGADDVDVKSIFHITSTHEAEVSDVHRHIADDEEHLQGCKLQWALLVSQIGKWYALEGIDSHGDKHGPDVCRMVGVSHGTAQWMQEDEYQGHEEQGGAAHHAQDCGIYFVSIFSLLVDKAEEGGLHTVSQDDENQSRIGIHVGDDTITTTGCTDGSRVEWHKQIVEESADDTAQTIDGGILCE